MSGLMGGATMAVEMQNLQSDSGNYRIVTFPQRVRITSVGFTFNYECMGSYKNQRVWKIYCMVGHPNPSEGSPWGEYTHPIFGLSEKPTVSRDRLFTSSFMENSAQVVQKPNSWFEDVAIDFGVIEPGGYLTFWVQNDSGDISTITWEDTAATVTITYEPTSLMTAQEVFAKYPELD